MCPHGKLNFTIGVNVCKVERQLIKQEAAKKNMSISEFLRWKITGNHLDMSDAIVSEE